jgi:ethanolamine-phosphate cytidylyltransferase
MNEKYLLSVIEKYNIDYVVHGDDPCIVDGKDVYESARKLGKYLTIPRTEGISTTDIVGRMLLMTRSHHSSAESDIDDLEKRPRGGSFGISSSPSTSSLRDSFPSFGSLPGTSTPPNEPFPERPVALLPESKLASKSTGEFSRKSNFLTTSRIVRLFGAGVKAPVADNKVIYLHGSWDMFHAGHVSILEKARSLGDYVIVGIHNDAVVNQHCGMNLPIMNLHERVLSVLGCKFVDDVLIDAPPIISKEMIDYLQIHLVVKGNEFFPQLKKKKKTAEQKNLHLLFTTTHVFHPFSSRNGGAFTSTPEIL